MSTRSLMIILLSIVIVVALLMIIFLLAFRNSDSTISGFYRAGLSINRLTYEFKRNGNVTLHLDSFGNEYMNVDGKYELSEDGNFITFIFSSDDEKVSAYGGTFSLVRGPDYLFIGAVKYDKVESLN